MNPNANIYITKHPSEDKYIAIIDGERGYNDLSPEVRHNKDFADKWNARHGHTDEDIMDAVLRSMRD